MPILQVLSKRNLIAASKKMEIQYIQNVLAAIQKPASKIFKNNSAIKKVRSLHHALFSD